MFDVCIKVALRMENTFDRVRQNGRPRSRAKAQNMRDVVAITPMTEDKVMKMITEAMAALPARDPSA